MIDLKTASRFRDGYQEMHDAMCEMDIPYEHYETLRGLFYRVWNNFTQSYPHTVPPAGDQRHRKGNIVAVWPQDYRTIGDMKSGEEGYTGANAVVDGHTIVEEFPVYENTRGYQQVRVKCISPHQYVVHFSSVAHRRAWLEPGEE